MATDPKASVKSSWPKCISTKFKWNDEIHAGNDETLIFARQIGVPDEEVNSLIKFNFKLFHRRSDQDANKSIFSCYFKVQDDILLDDFVLDIKVFDIYCEYLLNYASM